MTTTVTNGVARVKRTPDAEGKIACRFCGDRMGAGGVGRHESRCSQNPLLKAPANDVATRVRARMIVCLQTVRDELAATQGVDVGPNTLAHIAEARTALAEHDSLAALLEDPQP